MDQIKSRDVQQLLQYFSTYTYKAKESHPIAVEAMQKCLYLMSQDYDYTVINNSSGDLSDRYPSHILFLDREKNCKNSTIDTSSEKLRDLISKARFARCRSRFPVPVILYHGKHICRSATLSGGPELYGRSGLNFFFSGTNDTLQREDESVLVPRTQSEWQLFDKVRNQDIRLLKTLDIGTIIDFMVEKKKIKFGVYVTSSEKVDKENRYVDFNIVSLPYPGCEFFKEFRENDYSGDGLKYDWKHPQVDTVIGVPLDSTVNKLQIDWENYQEWDLTLLTKNYIKLILNYLEDSSNGLLIHCISGWDRTPLFVSLLRLSLWADGLIHQSLNPIEILYLTLAYDWMLFGHHLVDRLSRGEEILLFCFHFLMHLSEAEFSLLIENQNNSTSVQPNSDTTDPVFVDFEQVDSTDSFLVSNSNESSSDSSEKNQQDPMSFYYNQTSEVLEENSNGNYTWSMLSVPEEEAASNYTPKTNRTSPMAVPSSEKIRSRQDSSGSVSTGSWQIISDSVWSTSAEDKTSNNSAGIDVSSQTVVESPADSSRKEKLKDVQSLFYKIYHSTSPLPSEGLGIGSLLGNFAEKVGIFPAAHS